MKKASSYSGCSQPTTAADKAIVKLKKDGTPDRRYRNAKEITFQENDENILHFDDPKEYKESRKSSRRSKVSRLNTNILFLRCLLKLYSLEFKFIGLSLNYLENNLINSISRIYCSSIVCFLGQEYL